MHTSARRCFIFLTTDVRFPLFSSSKMLTFQEIKQMSRDDKDFTSVWFHASQRHQQQHAQPPEDAHSQRGQCNNKQQTNKQANIRSEAKKKPAHHSRQRVDTLEGSRDAPSSCRLPAQLARTCASRARGAWQRWHFRWRLSN